MDKDRAAISFLAFWVGWAIVGADEGVVSEYKGT